MAQLLRFVLNQHHKVRPTWHTT